MTWTCFEILMVAALAAEPTPATSPALELEHCWVSLIQDVRVPAEEQGVLMEVVAHEGEQIKKGTSLGRIDDVSTRLEQQAAKAELAISEEKAANDVNVRYAEAARNVASSELQLNEDANSKVRGTKSFVEIEKLRLTVEHAALQIEQARHEQKLAGLQTQVEGARVELADDQIRRRQLRAPLDGEIVEVFAQAGEWVQPGDPVFRIIRMDRLRVEGFVNAGKHTPVEVAGRPVRVSVPLAHGETTTFEGRITFVDPRVHAGNESRIWA
ncbi:MAG TPA: HlyD family efflux transporter periplasmic adaptor subunit, partial [Pirellulales bacterium]|nr:HlyD family efflux transporter periplasmic adaptor subunit [Pirellulales bacterium]